MSNNFKLLMENWRGYVQKINEQSNKDDKITAFNAFMDGDESDNASQTAAADSIYKMLSAAEKAKWDAEAETQLAGDRKKATEWFEGILDTAPGDTTTTETTNEQIKKLAQAYSDTWMKNQGRGPDTDAAWNAFTDAWDKRKKTDNYQLQSARFQVLNHTDAGVISWALAEDGVELPKDAWEKRSWDLKNSTKEEIANADLPDKILALPWAASNKQGFERGEDGELKERERDLDAEMAAAKQNLAAEKEKLAAVAAEEEAAAAEEEATAAEEEAAEANLAAMDKEEAEDEAQQDAGGETGEATDKEEAEDEAQQDAGGETGDDSVFTKVQQGGWRADGTGRAFPNADERVVNLVTQLQELVGAQKDGVFGNETAGKVRNAYRNGLGE